MEEQETAAQGKENYLVSFKNFNLFHSFTDLEFLKALDDFEIKDSDIFLITYPFSGTVWSQQIVNLILYDEHQNGTENVENLERAPCLEYSTNNIDLVHRPSPRIFSSHLPYYIMPKALRNKKGKVVYVYRNPKVTMSSFYHFTRLLTHLEATDTTEDFMERFLAGNDNPSNPLPYLPSAELSGLTLKNPTILIDARIYANCWCSFYLMGCGSRFVQ
ncbi:amine sulfotransferase-like [Tachyglossus aculeatus]|uniref:amine sulfotransferase-like n=1 Tax=Tachyglossus aculeatus TaxID=9261 RepID=UPI0018F6B6CB|nr:amine sulfotransferase-like [Tachyglossus aculeatus]